MAKSFALAVLLGVTFIASLGQARTVFSAEETVETHYILACARGLILGINQGLHKNNSITLNTNCLADDSAINAMTIYDGYLNGSLNDGLEILLAAYNLHYSVDKYCGVVELNHDMVNFLAEGKFTFSNLFDNFIKKLFTVTGALNNIGEIFFTTTLPAESNTAAYFTLYNTVGLNIGSILNIVLGYK